MTREEAKREMLFAKRNVVADSWIDKAYDMAIQALSEPERKKGNWIPHKSIFGGLGEKVYTCDQCGYNIGFHTENFCPNCGADMRGEHDEA